MTVAFIDDNRDEFSVESIVRALKMTGARIAVSSYYAYKKRRRPARAIRDEELCAAILEIYEVNYSCLTRATWSEIRARRACDQAFHDRGCALTIRSA